MINATRKLEVPTTPGTLAPAASSAAPVGGQSVISSSNAAAGTNSAVASSIQSGASTGSTSAAKGQTKGLDGGAMAGVAIGMLLAGILVASIAWFFVLRRQKSKNCYSAAVSDLASVAPQSKSSISGKT